MMRMAASGRLALIIEVNMAHSSWDSLRSGDNEDGLHQMRELYAGRQSASNAMRLGVAYLWIGRFRAAWEHFHRFNETYPLDNSGTYGMEGVAMWCMNEPDEAVGIWRTGLDCEFADAGISIMLPLFLFFASIVKPNVFSRDETEQILAKQLKSPRSDAWPGPLARFALGKIDEATLRAKAICDIDYPRKDEVTASNNWQADFYIGIMELATGNRAVFLRTMRKVSNLTWADYDMDKNLFLSKLWCEELFLARHALSMEQ